MEPNPPGFDPDVVIAGLHTAMVFGAANNPEDRVAFCWSEITGGNTPADGDGVPFDPNARPTKIAHRVLKPCAVEYVDVADKSERFADVQTSKIQITILAPDYADVADFTFVVWGGDKYIRRSSEIIALGSIDVYLIQCRGEDES